MCNDNLGNDIAHPEHARAAMRLHLWRVLTTTKVDEVDQARERVQQQRKRYSALS
jgi:hypothetical protein